MSAVRPFATRAKFILSERALYRMPASERFSRSAIVAALLPAAARVRYRTSSSDVQGCDDDGGVDLMIVIPRPAYIQAQPKAEGNSLTRAKAARDGLAISVLKWNFRLVRLGRQA
jgi:hypothetical protein